MIGYIGSRENLIRCKNNLNIILNMHIHEAFGRVQVYRRSVHLFRRLFLTAVAVTSISGEIMAN